MKYDFKPNLQRELDPQTSQAISASIDNMSGYLSAAGANRKQRKWNEKMYQQQRADNFVDWQLENHYNSPKQQMARLAQAGLNPNLVYGHGADAQGGQLQSPSPMSWDPKVPPTDLGSKLATYMDMEMRQAQVQNIKSQNDLIVAQTNNLNASTRNRDVDTEGKTFRNRFNLKNEALDINQKEANLHATNVQSDKGINEIALSRNRDYREAILNSSTVKEATARITEIYARINNLMPAQIAEINQRIAQMEKDGKLKDYEIELNDAGTHKGDNWIFSIMSRIMRALTGGMDAPWRNK